MIASNTLIDSPKLGSPTIGDDCYIGVGAKIIGNVRIGNKVRIGANCVVTNDIPDFSMVTVGEQRVVQWDDRMDNRFYHRFQGKWRYLENGEWHEVLDPDDLKLFNSRFGEG
jgi:serine O-acetyltransferase